MGIPQRKSSLDMTLFAERRKRLATLCPGSAFVLPAKPEMIRNGANVTFPHRQDSNFFYLSGFEESGSMLVFRPGLHPEYVLFVRPKDPTRELWDGFRYGPEAAAREFGADAAYDIAEFDQRMPELLKPVERVYLALGRDPEFDQRMVKILTATRLSHGRAGVATLTVADPNGPLGEMRVIKTTPEAQMMRKAGQLSAEAHRAVMRACRPELNERAMQGVFMNSIYQQNSAREGYGLILASGANATCLHYTFNDQPMRDGDLFLIDAGAEFHYYTADITRTYPVNGKFTDVQRRFYQNVLNVQKAIIDMVRPGQAYAELQTKTVEMLTEVMFEYGLLKTSRDEAIASLEYKKYYPHGVSHYLGMDVHDLGLYVVDGESRPLEPGMTLTIEPGLYIPFDDETAPPELRGLGVRIEDDILVTAHGHEVLTSHAPKEIADLEAIVGKN